MTDFAPCPEGSVSPFPGASACSACPENAFRVNLTTCGARNGRLCDVVVATIL